MLTIHCTGDDTPRTWTPGTTLPDHGTWFDLREPTDEETRIVAEATGLPLPTRQQISGIGLSSRNRRDGEALFLHVSRFTDAGDNHGTSTPLALVLTPEILVTQRYAASRAFDLAAAQWYAAKPQHGSSGAFVDLVETLANRTAEDMQSIAADSAGLSDEVFSEKRQGSHAMRRLLMHVGHLESRLVRSRASLLGISRIVTFMHDRKPSWIPALQ